MKEGIGLNFSGKVIKNRDFSTCFLVRANFRKTDLVQVIFNHADLRFADFRGSFIGYADFSDADLRGAALDGVYLKYAIIRDANLIGAWYDKFTDFPEGFDPKKPGCFAQIS
jgi:uncharacterized protein YjbI with pentapeptide repeats